MLLEIGKRYLTFNGCVVLITERRAYDRSQWKSTPPDCVYFFMGHCVIYSDGTEAKSTVPLSWHQDGAYGAHHPLTIVKETA